MVLSDPTLPSAHVIPYFTRAHLRYIYSTVPTPVGPCSEDGTKGVTCSSCRPEIDRHTPVLPIRPGPTTLLDEIGIGVL